MILAATPLNNKSGGDTPSNTTTSILHAKQQKGKDIILKTDNTRPALINDILLSLKAAAGSPERGVLFISDSVSNIENLQNTRHYSVINLNRRDISVEQKHTRRSQSTLITGSSQQVIDHLRRDNLNLQQIRNVVIDAFNYESSAAFNAHVSFVFQKFSTLPPTVVVAKTKSDDLKEILGYLRNPIEIENKEKGEIHMNKSESSRISRDKRKANRIQGIVKKMIVSESPEDLDEYRTLVRRNVSIFKRSYLAGYLFKILVEKDSSRMGSSRNAPSRGSSSRSVPRVKKTRSESAHSHHRMSKSFPTSDPDNNIRCLYVNVGKIHGLTEESLNELLEKTSVLGKDGVESYSILDRFSFINVPNDKADKLIHELNAVGYYGKKKMSVTYSHR